MATMMFDVVEVCGGRYVSTYATGAGAAGHAEAVNAVRLDMGNPTRVRVVRRKVDLTEERTIKLVRTRDRMNGAKPTMDRRFTKAVIEYTDEVGATWRRRELRNMAGTPLVPWANEKWWLESKHFAVHYPHVSRKFGDMLAYTPEEEDGVNDRQVRTRPGKYLTYFFQDVLPAGAIERWAGVWAARHGKPGKLRITMDPDEIAEVYTRKDGPESCMSYAADGFECGPHSRDPNESLHPTYVYGAGDLGVAWVENSVGSVAARTIVWPEKKIWVRCFGDFARLTALLKDEGYTNGSIEGAKLLRIEVGSGFVCPFLDYHDGVIDDLSHLIVGGNDYEFDYDSGLATEPGPPCENCCERIEFETGQRGLCETCYDELWSCCEGCGEETLIDNLCWVEQLEARYCDACVDALEAKKDPEQLELAHSIVDAALEAGVQTPTTRIEAREIHVTIGRIE